MWRLTVKSSGIGKIRKVSCQGIAQSDGYLFFVNGRDNDSRIAIDGLLACHGGGNSCSSIVKKGEFYKASPCTNIFWRDL